MYKKSKNNKSQSKINKNQSKGITLIALVITIIVLLILAGVTIMMLMGSENAPQKASEAVEKDAIAGAKDEVAMEAQSAILDYFNKKYVEGNGTDGASTQSVVEEAAEKAVDSAKNKNKQLLPDSGVTDNTITLKTKSYTVTGTIDEKGGISWSNPGAPKEDSENEVKEVLGSIADWAIDESTNAITSYIGEPIKEDTIMVPNCVEKDGIKVPIKVLGNGTSPVFTDSINIEGKKLKIAEGIEKINDIAFAHCDKLQGDLIIPNSVNEIGADAFFYCSGFTGDLIIPNSVETLGEYAFDYCSGFNGKIVISNQLSSIPDYAFCDCSGFTGELVIPEKVMWIGRYAFYGCESLESIIIENKELQYSSNTFGGGCPPFQYKS